MTWAIPSTHTHSGTTGHREHGLVQAIRWPRGLSLIGFVSLLVSAWGGLVPFIGPTFGFNANGTSSWHWTVLHAWLYVVPGAIGVVASLLLMARARAGSFFARAELLFLGVVLMACGAWFVLGPFAWPIVAPGGANLTVFASDTPRTVLLNMVGYNLGVGLVLAAIGGMAVMASISERIVATGTPIGVERSGTRIPVPDAAPAPTADPTAVIPSAERTSAYPTIAAPQAAQPSTTTTPTSPNPTTSTPTPPAAEEKTIVSPPTGGTDPTVVTPSSQGADPDPTVATPRPTDPTTANPSGDAGTASDTDGGREDT